MNDTPVPITAHLAELRRRIVRVLLAWIAGAILAWRYKEAIFSSLLAPAVEALGPQGRTLQAIAPTEIFFTYLKCAALAGFFIALPVVFWQTWSFIAPGLYASEKRVVVPFVLISTLLFAGGAAFGHTVVFPLVFDFFMGFDADAEFVHSAWTLRLVFSLTTQLLLAFGIAFELPVAVFFLALSGIVDARQLLAGTPYAVLGVFVAAAILTPPDFISQLLLAFPMIVLYLVGVGVAWLFGGRKTDR